MIFNVPGHINMIRNGLFYDLASKPEFSECIKGMYPPRYKSGTYPLIIKTETRRPNRGIYQVGKDYAVQRKRGIKAESDIRIVMDGIWKETGKVFLISPSGRNFANATEISITKEDAWAEGGYTPEQYEKVFREINPKWGGWSRWAFEFHVIEIKNSNGEQQKLERSLKHLHQEITEHIHPYITTKKVQT